MSLALDRLREQVASRRDAGDVVSDAELLDVVDRTAQPIVDALRTLAQPPARRAPCAELDRVRSEFASAGLAPTDSRIRKRLSEALALLTPLQEELGARCARRDDAPATGPTDDAEPDACVICNGTLDAGHGPGCVHIFPFENSDTSLRLRTCEACCVQLPLESRVALIEVLVEEKRVTLPGNLDGLPATAIVVTRKGT